MNIHIRPAALEDAAVIHSMYDHYIANSLATFHEHNKPFETRVKEMAELLETYPFLVAEDENGTFLGFANGEPIRPQSGYRYCVELTIYLHPDAPRGQGIGKALYNELLRMLTEQGFCTAVGILYGGNEESLALHEHFGFKEAALLQNAGRKMDQWLDARIMVKTLNPYTDDIREPIPFSEYRKQMKRGILL